MWFGDERGYNATSIDRPLHLNGCGLVMKEDITQHVRNPISRTQSCGLVMKEDITQHTLTNSWMPWCCGLVMKEDITQPVYALIVACTVVVW